MLCSSQQNRELTRAPTRIFVWRQSLRVGVRAEGTDLYGKSEPLQGTRCGPDRRRVPAAQRGCRQKAPTRRGRRGHARRGRRGLPAGPGVPGVRRRGRLEERIDHGRGFKVALQLLRQEVHPPPTGTVLEHCRKPLPVWISFIRLMLRNVPVECAAELRGVTHKTAFDWRHRVLATISGYLDRYVYLFRVNQARRMRFSCKGGAPYPDGRRDRRDLPQLGVGAASPII